MYIVFQYCYADASNYKIYGNVYFELLTNHNEPFSEIKQRVHKDKTKIFKACLDGEFFVASQVNIPVLQNLVVSFPNEDDHGLSRFLDLEIKESIPSETDKIFSDKRSWDEFIQEFELQSKKGWTPGGDI